MQSILLLGSRSDFSAIVLSHLARAGFARLRAAVLKDVPAASSAFETASHSLAVSVPDPLSRAAEKYGTPLDTFDALTDILRHDVHPDLIVTACFPRRLPPALLNRPRSGCLNVHPSPLPAYRGPSPVFWQLRAGETMSGVTIHKLSEALDAGDIVARESIPLSAEMTAQAINRALVDAGGRLLVRALTQTDWDALPSTVQDHAKASYYSWPVADDFEISKHWSAERAFRFMRGTAAWGQPYVVDLEGARLVLDRALEFDAAGQLPVAWARDGDDVRIAFKPGVLRAVGRESRFKSGRGSHRAAGPD